MDVTGIAMCDRATPDTHKCSLAAFNMPMLSSILDVCADLNFLNGQEMEKGKGVVPPVPESLGAAPFTAEDAREWQEWQEYSQDYNRYDYEFDEDDEVSPFSSAACVVLK